MKIVLAQIGDLPALFALLEDSGLPAAGLAAHLATTLVARGGEQLLGSAALELYGTDARLALGCCGCSTARHGSGEQLNAAGGDRAEAGVDVLAIANQLQDDPDLAAKTLALVKKLLHEGTLTLARIDES